MVKKLWEKNKYIILSAIIFGIAAHGMALLNKLSTHDDGIGGGMGTTYTSGRWMLYIIKKLQLEVIGRPSTMSTPLFNGLLSLVFIAVAACFIIGTLKIKNQYLQIMLSGLMAVFPTITSLFAYMFTAPYYMLSICAGSFAVWIISQNKRWYCWLAGGIILGCCVGIYQAYIPFFVGLCLLACINEVYTSEDYSLKAAIKTMLYYGGACVMMLVTYLLLNKLMLDVKHAELTTYEGISGFGVTSISGYIKRIILAYKEFFAPTAGAVTDMYPLRARLYYYVALTAAVIFSAFIALKVYRKSNSCLFALLELALICLIPLASDFIYVMVDEESIHSLMTYGDITAFVYLVWAADNMGPVLPKKAACASAATILALMNLVYLKYDNICYLEAEILQEESKSYYTELVARIQSTDGYSSDMPVIYLNELNKVTESPFAAKEFSVVNIAPYGYYYSINDYSWKSTMKMWTGFDPVLGDYGSLGNNEKIGSLTVYPDEGSIAVIDGNVVVRFA